MATHKISKDRWYSELDSRKRVNLANIAQHDAYRVRRLPNGVIILDPATVLSLAEIDALSPELPK